MVNLQELLKNKFTLFLILGGLVLLGLVAILSQNILKQNKQLAEVIDVSFDPEGPYALLTPRRDGNALILQLKRTASYDKITYELAYASLPENIKAGSGEEVAAGGVERGVVGEVNTTDKKGEYEQEILFGTCSRNVCKYDKGVENGTLTLNISKGNKKLRMVSQWHIQQPDVALGILTSGDGHFKYTIQKERQELASIGYTILNDLTGAPKLPAGKLVQSKVYALNAPLIRDIPKGVVYLKLAKPPVEGSKLARYDYSDGKWVEYDTNIEGSTLTASVEGAGIFAVLSPK